VRRTIVLAIVGWYLMARPSIGFAWERARIVCSRTLRILLREAVNRRSSLDLNALLNQLRDAGIDAVGGGRFGEQDMILIDREADIPRAIDMLAGIGIHATRG
jgi:hypothetical protein